MRKGIVAALMLAVASAGSSAGPLAFTYQGLCDASAVESLGSAYFVVADDESNHLRIYKRGDAKLHASVPLSAFLNVKETQETDIEAAATIGNRIFWISSHGTNSKAKEKPARRKFFATDIQNGKVPTVVTVGKPYNDLLPDLFKSAALRIYQLAAGSKIAPKQPDALNIEGLAADGAGGLLIGFRNPVPHGKALLVPLKNPNDLIQGKPAQFGDPIELALDGMGIRSIERVGSGYYIVAGPIDKGSGALYQWSGKRQAKPKKIELPELAGLVPEALALIDTNTLLILSDDGSQPGSAGVCKDLPSKDSQSFRSLELKID